MIEIIYKGEKYNYGDCGSQNYDIKTKIVMDKDCSVYDIILAISKLMNIASYQVSVKTLRQACDYIEEEYGIDKII